MNIPSYMKQVSGSVVIDCNELPDSVFLDCTMQNDIVKARIISVKSYYEFGINSGGNDVLIKHITGQKEFISKSDLVNKYSLANGRRIRIPFIKSNQDFIAISRTNGEYKFFKLPNNCVGVVNGRKAQPGTYIICKAGEDGVDRESISSVSPKTFRKAFRIPMQEAIKRNIGRGSRTFTLISRNNGDNRPRIGMGNMQNNSYMDNQSRASRIALNEQIRLAKIDADNIRNNAHDTNRQQVNKPIDISKKKYEFRAVAKLVTMDGTQTGFQLIHLENNSTLSLNMNQVYQLCKEKKVENIMLVQNRQGKQFFKGNGIVLDNLPKVMM